MSLDADVVEALLGSLERKQRECDKAYELIRVCVRAFAPRRILLSL